MDKALFTTAVVFGASGFVGQNLVRALMAQGMDVIALRGQGSTAMLPCASIWPDSATPHIFPAETVFFHLAAHRYDASAFATSQHDLLKYNQSLTMQAYEFCLLHGIKEMRMASSIAVYGRDAEWLDDATPLDLNTMPYASEAMYGWSKRFAEIAASLHQTHYGIHTISFRLSNPYGPYDALEESKAHVVPAFILRALNSKGDFAIRGNPAATRDFIFVDDVVRVLLSSLQRGGVTDAYNLGSGSNTRIDVLARNILSLCGTADRALVTDGKSHSDVVTRRLNTEKLRRDFATGGFTPLEAGLAKTVDWIRHAATA